MDWFLGCRRVRATERPVHKDIATYLKDVGGHADVVLLNWRIMTDNGLIHKDARPVQQRFTQPMLPLDKRVKFTDIPENDHVKAFVRGGIERLKFADTPHCPTKPADMIAVNSNGERAKLSAFTPFQHRYAWIDHYHTKTAEEFLQVPSRVPVGRTLRRDLPPAGLSISFSRSTSGLPKRRLCFEIFF